MEIAGISLLLESGAKGPHFEAEHACSAGTVGEIGAFLPEIADWNKNNSEPAIPARSRDEAMNSPAIRVCASIDRGSAY